MRVEQLGPESFGGSVVDGGFDSLLAPPTGEEVAQDSADLADIRQAEASAAHERPYFI